MDEPRQDADHLGRMPPFSPRQMMRELRVDTALRALIVAAALGLLVAAFSVDVNGSVLSFVAIALAVGAWMFLNGLSGRVSAQLPQLTVLIDTDPRAAEVLIAQFLGKRPLLRWVRLMVYHRLAMLRHRQRRFAEASSICQMLLRYPVGPGREAVASVLLMLTEARLECGDVVGAYHALARLYATPMNLFEHLQRVALQTRYELMIGAHEAALRGAQRKVQLVELMPAPQCGAVHAMLATAADRVRQTRLASWLWRRAELLCTPEQMAQLKRGGFGVALVESGEEMAGGVPGPAQR